MWRANGPVTALKELVALTRDSRCEQGGGAGRVKAQQHILQDQLHCAHSSITAAPGHLLVQRELVRNKHSSTPMEGTPDLTNSVEHASLTCHVMVTPEWEQNFVAILYTRLRSLDGSLFPLVIRSRQAQQRTRSWLL